jgi:hypothetical protein
MSEVVHPGDIHTSFDGKYLFGDGTDKWMFIPGG